MDEAAAERIRKARGEKVSSPARLPRVSPLFTPLPGRVCPTSIHCRAAKQGGKRHRQGGASTRGEQWQRQRRREARRRRREVRQAVGRGISNVLDRGMGIKWMGGFSPGWTGRRSAGSGHGTGRVGLFACCFWEPWRRWDIWFMTLAFLLLLLLLLRRSSLAFLFNGNLNTMTGPAIGEGKPGNKTSLTSYQGRTTSRMGCRIAYMLGSILRGIEPYIRGSNCMELAGRSGWSASRRRLWSNGSPKTPEPPVGHGKPAY